MIKEFDIYGRTPLIQAASGGYVECAHLLLENVCITYQLNYSRTQLQRSRLLRIHGYSEQNSKLGLV